jgi:hypothetical protein
MLLFHLLREVLPPPCGLFQGRGEGFLPPSFPLVFLVFLWLFFFFFVFPHTQQLQLLPSCGMSPSSPHRSTPLLHHSSGWAWILDMVFSKLNLLSSVTLDLLRTHSLSSLAPQLPDAAIGSSSRHPCVGVL